jgi:chemotaxis protein methyltransferase WspC
VEARRPSEGTPHVHRRAARATEQKNPPAKADAQERERLLAQARRQADGGQLGPALDLCRTIQDRFGPSADVYSLTGIIHQAQQDRPAATQAFRKALYLEPNHREALTHLMLLCRQLGDLAQAELLRKRLERLPAEPGGEP